MTDDDTGLARLDTTSPSEATESTAEDGPPGTDVASAAAGPSSTAPGSPTRRRFFRSRWDFLAVVPAALVVFAVAARLSPPRSGVPALVMILEAQLFLAVLVVLTPIAFAARARILAVTLAVAMVAGGGLFGSEWVSLPGSGASRQDLSVMTWNLQYGTRSPAETAAALEGVTADIVALQELEPDPAAAIEADAAITARYPYRAMAPRIGAWGVAILSRFPIGNVRTSFPPAVVEVVVETPRGPVTVIDAHPNHADIRTATRLRVPVGYDPSNRDEEIAAIRARIDDALGAGVRLLVVGDYNTSPSEAEYGVLAKGLRDTQVQVGEGPGWTWRPSRIDFLPAGFLRIDLQLTAGSIVPASVAVDCSVSGDHCRLIGGYEIDA
jgi:endonuclease/exonuclease/phosphatase family metal-dependent hydrolase